MPDRKRRLTLPCLLAIIAAWTAAAGKLRADWPQFLGPQRNGVADSNQQLGEKWPRVLPAVWTRDIGSGYAGPVILGEWAIVFHRKADKNLVQKLNLANGELIWESSYPAKYGGGINSDSGPRCTPVVDGDQVLVMSAAGVLAAFDLETGQLRWQRDLYGDYRALEGFFGAGSTPLVYQDRILINVGGRAENSGIVALNRKDGATVWSATKAGASYSSPIIAAFDGQPCAIFVTRLSVVGLNPDNGEPFFEFRFGTPGPAVNGATPLVFDGQLFVCASYGVGARLVGLQGSAETLWSKSGVLDSQYSTSVYDNGFLYGSHGREDVPGTSLRCVDAKTGKIRWSQEGVGVAHVIRVRDELLVLEVESGRLLRVACDPAAYRELGVTQAADSLCRAAPAVDQGLLLLRTNQGDGGQLRCLQVGQPFKKLTAKQRRKAQD